MKAILRKEAIEISVLAGPAILALTLFWFGNFRFQSVLLAPHEDPVLAVLFPAAIAGLLLGYLHFSAERWLGRLGYLVHRGGGERAAFAAKATAGAAATFLVGLGPAIAFVLAHVWTDPNASIIQWQRVLDLVGVSTVGASAYGVGVLASQLRRRLLTDVFFLAVAGGGVLASSYLAMRLPAAWNMTFFVVLHLGLGAIFLTTAGTLSRSGLDGDLAIPRGAHANLALVATPVLVFALLTGVVAIQTDLLGELGSRRPAVLMQRSTGEVFAAVPIERQWYRLSEDGEPGPAIEYRSTFGKHGDGDDFDLVHFPARSAPTLFDVMWRRRTGLRLMWDGVGYDYSAFAGRRSRIAGGGDYEYSVDYQTGIMQLASFPGQVTSYFDRENGVLRVFGVVMPRWRGGESEGADSRRPFARTLDKPDGRGRFSRETRVFPGNDPENPVTACLVDPIDGSIWNVIGEEWGRSVSAATLPGGDGFVRFEARVPRSFAEFGDSSPFWYEPLIVGERGIYSWSGAEFRAADLDPDYVPASEVPSIAKARASTTDFDPIERRVEVRDRANERVLFAATLGPRTVSDRLFSILAQGVVLLRPPSLNFLATVDSTDTESPNELLFDPTVARGRRIGLVLVDFALAVLCTVAAVRWLLRRGAASVNVGLWATIVVLLGPFALLALWLFEPRAVARRAISAEPEPLVVLVERSA